MVLQQKNGRSRDLYIKRERLPQTTWGTRQRLKEMTSLQKTLGLCKHAWTLKLWNFFNHVPYDDAHM